MSKSLEEKTMVKDATISGEEDKLKSIYHFNKVEFRQRLVICFITARF